MVSTKVMRSLSVRDLLPCILFALISLMCCLSCQSNTDSDTPEQQQGPIQEVAGTYEILVSQVILLANRNATNILYQGKLVLEDHPSDLETIPMYLQDYLVRGNRHFQAELNGCYLLKELREDRRGVSTGSLTHWQTNSTADSIRFQLFRTVDSSYNVMAQITAEGFRGIGTRADASLARLSQEERALLIGTVVGRRIGPPDQSIYQLAAEAEHEKMKNLFERFWPKGFPLRE